MSMGIEFPDEDGDILITSCTPDGVKTGQILLRQEVPHVDLERDYPDHYYLSRATLYLEDRDGNEDVSQRPHNAEQTGIVLGLIRQAQQVAASESKGLVAGFLTREDITLFTAAGMHYSTELTRCIIWPELNEGTSLPEHTVLTAYGMDIRAHRFGHEPTSNEVWGLLPTRTR